MKNLVMGAATGYGWQELEPFVTSCKKFCPDADLVLFVDNVSDFTRDKLIRGGATLEQIPATFKDILIVNSRFKMYLDYLQAHGANYAQVFISDTRDIIFQGDLFAPFKGYTNWLGYATEFLTIGEDMECNYPWLVNRFGTAEADKLVDKKIICAGTIIGSTDAMKIFCRKMWELILQALKNDYDQGTMNYLVWNNLLPIENLIEIDVQSGEIFTNGLIKDNKTFGDKILRGDGGVPAVVHQYDRHENLVKLVDKVYRDKNFHADERFTDLHSLIDQIECLFLVERADEATQFFTKNFSTKEKLSDSAYDLLKFWNFLATKNFDSIAEELELAVQSAIASFENPADEFLGDMINTFAVATKNNRPIDPHFKNTLMQFFAKIFLTKEKSYDSAYDLLKFWNFLATKNFDSIAEELELAVQSAIASFENPADEFLGDMINTFAIATKNNRPIAPHFKKYFARHLLPIAKRNFDAGNFVACLNCINFIEALDVPQDKNFYLFAARAYRIFGRNEQALTAYTKALELC